MQLIYIYINTNVYIKCSAHNMFTEQPSSDHVRSKPNNLKSLAARKSKDLNSMANNRLRGFYVSVVTIKVSKGTVKTLIAVFVLAFMSSHVHDL
jgi:hypothetical protein